MIPLPLPAQTVARLMVGLLMEVLRTVELQMEARPMMVPPMMGPRRVLNRIRSCIQPPIQK
jgi:hypothetical protein